MLLQFDFHTKNIRQLFVVKKGMLFFIWLVKNMFDW